MRWRGRPVLISAKRAVLVGTGSLTCHGHCKDVLHALAGRLSTLPQDSPGLRALHLEVQFRAIRDMNADLLASELIFNLQQLARGTDDVGPLLCATHWQPDAAPPATKVLMSLDKHAGHSAVVPAFWFDVSSTDMSVFRSASFRMSVLQTWRLPGGMRPGLRLALLYAVSSKSVRMARSVLTDVFQPGFGAAIRMLGVLRRAIRGFAVILNQSWTPSSVLPVAKRSRNASAFASDVVCT